MLATSVSGTPNIPEIAGIDNFKGEVLHSSRFKAGRQWAGRPVIVFGTGTSAHDICQELQAAGADVTMVQRSPTMVVNVEPAQLYDKTYLGDGPPIASRDILNSGVPLPVMKIAHKLVTDEVKRLDAPLLGRLEAIGFRLEYGEDGTGWPLKFRTRGGGYYFNVGASELIADGKIKLIQAADIEAYVAGGIRMRDGTMRKADLFVLATGYKGPDHLLTQLFGADVAKRVGRVWGFDEGDAGAPQHVDADAASGAVVHRRRVFAGANLQPLYRRADRCDRGGEIGEGGAVAHPLSCSRLRPCATIRIVVPANAGTHNHRRLLLKQSRPPSRSHNIRRGVWVPAFAGTTRENYANTSPPSRGVFRPSFAKSLRPKKRAQGMPGACCTRGLVCK